MGLVREVFLPTFFLELKKAQNLNRSLGTELSVKDCWYLPKGQDYPFQRVLTTWLNAAGFRNAHDVLKMTDSDSRRKVVHNWLKGDNIPFSEEISSFVDGLHSEAGRFDSAESWKGRLVFAAAMHRFCQQMDKYFSTQESGYSLKLLGMLQDIENDPTPIDSEGNFEERKTYFAARLVYRRLKGTARWQHKITKLSAGKPLNIRDTATRGEIEKIIKKHSNDLNPGNYLMDCLKDEILQQTKAGNEIVSKAETLHQKIFALGVVEINRLITYERAGGS
jgi:hypothetical protein